MKKGTALQRSLGTAATALGTWTGFCLQNDQHVLAPQLKDIGGVYGD